MINLTVLIYMTTATQGASKDLEPNRTGGAPKLISKHLERCETANFPKTAGMVS